MSTTTSALNPTWRRRELTDATDELRQAVALARRALGRLERLALRHDDGELLDRLRVQTFGLGLSTRRVAALRRVVS